MAHGALCNLIISCTFPFGNITCLKKIGQETLEFFKALYRCIACTVCTSVPYKR